MQHPAVAAVELRGSRARGTAGRFSDWDFVVRTDDFDALAAQLPQLLQSLEPLVEQWDRLSDSPCFMLILSGPTKIDVIFEGLPNPHQPPWSVSAQTVAGIDHHFWDWALWLASKADAGKLPLVAEELGKMHEHLLAPMGVQERPWSLREAVARYLEMRAEREKQFGVKVHPGVGTEVRRVIRALDEPTDDPRHNHRPRRMRGPGWGQ